MDIPDGTDITTVSVELNAQGGGSGTVIGSEIWTSVAIGEIAKTYIQ